MKIKRWIKVLLIGFSVFILLTILVLPPIVKNYFQSHSKAWLGRTLSIDKVNLNVFNGSITFKDFTLYEKDDSTVFISFKSLYLNSSLYEVVFGRYLFTEIKLSQPFISIVQQGNLFNYSDLEDRFMSPDTTTVVETSPGEVIKYWIRNISIDDAKLTYRNVDLGSYIQLDSVIIKCPVVAWDDPKQHYDFNLQLNHGGKATGSFDLNTESMAYLADYELDSLNIDILLPYVKDYMKVGSFKGLFSSHQVIAGNFNKPEAIATKGEFLLNDFALTDPEQGELVTAEAFKIVIDTINIENDIYDLKYLSLNGPYLKFELFEEGNNFTKLLNAYNPEEGMSSDSLSTAIAYGNIFALMAAYIQDISANYSINNYKADSLVLRNGKFVFNDYTLHSKFNYVLEDLVVKAESVSSSNDNIVFTASSILNTSGVMQGEISVDPDGFRDMVIHYTINELKVTDFNPYSNYYVAHPFTNGVCYYTSSSTIKDRYLVSNHKLEIKKIEVGKKEANKTAYDLPIRFVVALLRDKNGNVNVELPIEGNLNDPKYKIGKVIWQVFKNLIAKAVAAPGKLLAGKSGVNEKLLEGFNWQPLQIELDEDQKKSLEAMGNSLATTPEMKLDLITVYNYQKELDELALREGKKRFLFFHRKIASEKDESDEVEKAIGELHPQDSLFMAFVEEQTQTKNSLLSIFDKSKRLIGNEHLQNKLNQIFDKRKTAVEEYLVMINQAIAERVHLVQPKELKEPAYEVLSRMESHFYVEE